MRKFSRQIIQLLVAATVITSAGACQLVARVTHRGAAPALALPASGDEREALAAALRARRDQAWRAIRAGHRGDYALGDAMALSTVAAALDADATWTASPPTAGAYLDDLPRKYWWYLFVDPSHWAEGPLAADRGDSPGLYAAMMDAFDGLLTDRVRVDARRHSARLDATGYLAIHQLATLGVFVRATGAPEPQGVVEAESSTTIAAIDDPRAIHRDRLGAALREMAAEGLVTWRRAGQSARGVDGIAPWVATLLASVDDGAKRDAPVQLAFAAATAPSAGELRGTTTYLPGEAQRLVERWIADYTDEQRGASGALTGDAYLEALRASAPTDAALAMVRPIARLLRRLQVAQPLASASDRVNLRLVLARLLMTQGLPPAIVRDPRRFTAGTVDELAREIIRGQRLFQSTVRELAARDLDRDPPRAE